ncbi:hypothetical protein ACFL0M_01050 [Thermodesulfobacteriota bacterium]
MDYGAGTIVKSNKKMIWGHKISVLGLPRQGIALDASAVADAATFDGETLLPHVEVLFENLHEVNGQGGSTQDLSGPARSKMERWILLSAIARQSQTRHLRSTLKQY